MRSRSTPHATGPARKTLNAVTARSSVKSDAQCTTQSDVTSAHDAGWVGGKKESMSRTRRRIKLGNRCESRARWIRDWSRILASRAKPRATNQPGRARLRRPLARARRTSVAPSFCKIVSTPLEIPPSRVAQLGRVLRAHLNCSARKLSPIVTCILAPQQRVPPRTPVDIYLVCGWMGFIIARPRG